MPTKALQSVWADLLYDCGTGGGGRRTPSPAADPPDPPSRPALLAGLHTLTDIVDTRKPFYGEAGSVRRRVAKFLGPASSAENVGNERKTAPCTAASGESEKPSGFIGA